MKGPSLVVGHRLFLYDLAEGRVRAELVDPDRLDFRCVEPSPDRDHVATVGSDGTLTIWRTRDRAIVHRAREWTAEPGAPDAIECSESSGCSLFRATWSPHGKSVIVRGVGTGRVVDLGRGVTGDLYFESDPVYSSTGARAVLMGEGVVTVLDGRTFEEVLKARPASEASWSPSAERLVVSQVGAGRDWTVALWDVGSRKSVWTKKGFAGGWWSPNGDVLLSVSASRENAVLDAATGRTLATWSGSFTTGGSGVAWGGDGVAVIDDDALRLWRKKGGVRELGATLPNDPNHPEAGSCE